ncbi:hypothetical protein JKF63_05911 [Porcisia hertigi]|uniref:Uncharacterized protein n=1 Tax=Porcisia hertigi TaxID=2761500 RepID=A0A836LIB6_9TRYP|nr:hypothetical protein JKF63_05911 [Porcisia hertigi]
MPSMYVFPGGGVEGVDYTTAKAYLAENYNLHVQGAKGDLNTTQDFLESSAQLSAEEAEVEAWACRVAALRELTEEAACVLRKDGRICSEALWLKWGKSHNHVCAGDVSTDSVPLIYDLAAASRLRPVARWVSPRQLKYRYDTYFFSALVNSAVVSTEASEAAPSPHAERASSSGAEDASVAARVVPPQELPLMEQASEVSELIWVSPIDALRRHEDPSDSFSLAPPTYLILHGLSLQPSFASLEAAWAAPPPPSLANPQAKPPGELPYSSTLPCVEPRTTMTADGQRIRDFVLPTRYFHEMGWSVADGQYRFPGENFAQDQHFIRMFVGCAEVHGDTVDREHTILH